MEANGRLSLEKICQYTSTKILSKTISSCRLKSKPWSSSEKNMLKSQVIPTAKYSRPWKYQWKKINLWKVTDLCICSSSSLLFVLRPFLFCFRSIEVFVFFRNHHRMMHCWGVHVRLIRNWSGLRYIRIVGVRRWRRQELRLLIPCVWVSMTIMSLLLFKLSGVDSTLIDFVFRNSRMIAFFSLIFLILEFFRILRFFSTIPFILVSLWTLIVTFVHLFLTLFLIGSRYRFTIKFGD